MDFFSALAVMQQVKWLGLNWYECAESGEFWIEGTRGEPYKDAVEWSLAEDYVCHIGYLLSIGKEEQAAAFLADLVNE